MSKNSQKTSATQPTQAPRTRATAKKEEVVVPGKPFWMEESEYQRRIAAGEAIITE